jgi:hypothetical protein
MGSSERSQGSAFRTVVKAFSTFVPIAKTVTMITAAMAETMMPYSTAVAPSSFWRKKFLTDVMYLAIDLAPWKDKDWKLLDLFVEYTNT